MSKPKVSICCLAYNHEKFIRQALDSFLMQKTNFPFEVLVHDDASKDSTASVIREYEAKYPDIIKPIYQTQNQFAINKSGDKHFNFPRVQGEYVALCEGDDFWIDENKLQKQVDFLDNNADFSMCFHPVKVFYEDGSVPDAIFPDFEGEFKHVKFLDFITLLQKNFIQTNSVMYRWRLTSQEQIDNLYPDGILPSDLFLHLLHAHIGKIGYINEVMAAYRKHKNGLWKGDDEIFHLNYGLPELRFYLALEKQFPEYNKYEGHTTTCAVALSLLQTYLKHKRINEMQEILKLCPDCIKPKTT